MADRYQTCQKFWSWSLCLGYVALVLLLTFVSFVNMLELCNFLQLLPEKMKQSACRAM